MSKFFLGLAILFPICGGVVRADEQSDAIAILDAGIKAQGGETAMGKPVGLYYKLKEPHTTTARRARFPSRCIVRKTS